MDLSRDDVIKIIKIIEESAYDEVRLEIGDFKLHVKKHANTESASPRMRPWWDTGSSSCLSNTS